MKPAPLKEGDRNDAYVPDKELRNVPNEIEQYLLE
jgi:hypothetical protein